MEFPPTESLFGLWLIILFIMAFIGNGIVPVPLTAYVLWMGHFHQPWPIVLVGTLGTAYGWFFMDGWFRRHFSRESYWGKAIPERYHRWFVKEPRFFVFFFNALPFPFDPSRFLAVMHHVPTRQIALWIALGRLVRYALLVFVGAVLSYYQKLFTGVLIGMVVLPLVGLLLKWLKKRG